MRLFCFPCVGSSLSAYRDWQAELPRGLDWCPIELPGNEPLDTLVPAAADALTPWLDGEYAFFGHSLGGLVAFELARELRRRGRPGLRHLLMSGLRAPDRPSRLPPLAALPDSAFLDGVQDRYGRFADEVLREPELLDLIRPVLRADLRMI